MILSVNGQVTISIDQVCFSPDTVEYPAELDTVNLIPYYGGVCDISEPGVYLLSSQFNLMSWEHSINPTLFIGPSPYPLIVAINDKEVYRWGDLANSSTMANFSAVSVVLGDLKEGVNSLKIYFYSDGQKIAFPHFYIGEYQKVQSDASRQTLLNSHLIKSVAVMALFSSLIFLGYSASTRFKDRDILYFSFFAFTVFLTYLPLIMNAPTYNEVFWFKVSRIGLLFFPYFIYLFCSEFTLLLTGKAWRLFFMSLVMIFSMFLIHAELKSDLNLRFNLILLIYILPLLLLNFGMLVKSTMKDKNSSVILILIGYSAILFGAIYDIKYVLMQNEPYFWITPYCYFFLIVMIVLAVALRHSLVHRELLKYKAELIYTNQSLVAAHDHVLQEASAKEQFIKVIAHEFRTPLNGMQGTVQSLLNDSAVPKDVRKKNVLLASSFYRFELIVQNLLDYQALKNGEMDLQYRSFSIATTIEKVIDLCCDDAKLKSISLISLVNTKELPPKLMCDNTRIGLVLHNLIRNAIKFTEEGGVSISAEYLNQKLRIEVSDTGCGINEITQDQIFSAFKKGEAATFTQRYEGVGLGLAIVDATVKAMRGTVSFTSKIGKGTRFSIEIPMECPADEIKAKRSLRVLVVDDNMVNRTVAILQLKEHHYQTNVANNGQEAVNLVSKGVYDVVLMDVQMPVMDGLEATRHIKMKYPNLPIIGVTANSSRDECLAAGMNDVVFKPTTSDVLHEVITLYTS